MVYKDFKEKMLCDIFGEQKLYFFNDKINKLEELLMKKGAILEGKQTEEVAEGEEEKEKEKVLNFHILTACLKIHGYDCNKGQNPQSGDINNASFNSNNSLTYNRLNDKSIRIMNRFTAKIA